MNKPKSFNYYQDGGHGWIAVRRKFLKQLGVHDQITEYSFQKGGMVYLEEDCDLSTFWEAFKKEFGSEPLLISKYIMDAQPSPIRHYQRFAVKGIKINSKCGNCGNWLPKFSDQRTFFYNEKCLNAFNTKKGVTHV